MLFAVFSLLLVLCDTNSDQTSFLKRTGLHLQQSSNLDKLKADSETVNRISKNLKERREAVVLTTDNPNLLACRENMVEADTDGNDELNTDEYAYFIDLESDGAVDEPFGSLGAALIAIFFADACTVCYEKTLDDGCCLGRLGFIDLDNEDSIIFVCSLVRRELGITPAPTQAPIETKPPVAPSATPTVSPTVAKTSAPTQAPIETKPPLVPSTTPTTSPTEEESLLPDVPTLSPTDVATEPPTLSPTDVATEAPTSFPTSPPTSLPSELLCVTWIYSLNNRAGLDADDIMNEVNNTLKTGLEAAFDSVTINILNETFPDGDAGRRRDLRARSEVPRFLVTSASATPTPSVQPSHLTSDFPSDVPSDVPTEMPSVMSSDAPSSMTSEVPSVAPSVLPTLSPSDVITEEPTPSPSPSQSPTKYVDVEGAHRALELGLSDEFGGNYTSELHDMAMRFQSLRLNELRDRALWSTSSQIRCLSSQHGSRRLVYFTYDYPSEILRIVDNPFCQPDLSCVIIQQRVCVVLEAGDNATLVEEALEDGIQESVESQDFINHIPPEHLPPESIS